MSPSQRDDLLDGLRGQTVIIPDLDSVFPGWPREINKHIASIAPLVNEILDGSVILFLGTPCVCALTRSVLRYARNESMAAKLKKENLALLTSNWWPHADLKTLLDLAHFVGCIFTVDGMIDQASGSGKDKIEAFDALYHDTDDFVQKGLSPSNPTEAIEPRNVLGDCFLTLATLLRKRYTNGNRNTSKVFKRIADDWDTRTTQDVL